MTKRKVLITGAAGYVGGFYRRHIGDRYDLRLVDHKPIPDSDSADSLVLDIADPDSVQRACAGIDTVLHLAADPRTSAEFYADLLEPNFKGVYNVFRAAKDQGCARVIFASSINSVNAYPRDRQIREEDAPCPLNVYGASKAFGESLGAYFAAVEGLSVISVRIGWVGKPGVWNHPAHHERAIFVSESDLCQLFDLCIETPGIRHAIVHGISNNRTNRMDLTATRRLLGYEPKDDAFSF